MDHAVPQGMDQGMDRGVWIVCGFGALIHTLYFDSYPYILNDPIMPKYAPYIGALQV